LRTDIFQIRALGQTVICIQGEAAATVFYDPEKMQRKGAVPLPVQQTLTGNDAIHTTDGELHRQRKVMFLSLMTDENLACLAGLFNTELHQRFTEWEHRPAVCLFDEMARALTAAVCSWAGVALKSDEVDLRAADFITMVDAFGSIGLRNWKGRLARRRAERTIKKLIAAARAGSIPANEDTALGVVVAYREQTSEPLSNHLAAIELINVLRPTVDIAWYIVFAVMAFHDRPEWKHRFAANQDHDQLHFIDEVRRYYPFAPFMGAKTRQDFTWQDYAFPKGALVLLDMYGTNHDPRLWQQPYHFNPDRFRKHPIRPFDFLAQGGGGCSCRAPLSR
jgi:fatty-acid peroxygenase